jgi:uncharacterized membrane protein
MPYDAPGRIPLPALALGASGLLPFAAFLLGLWFGSPELSSWCAKALLNYGVVILAFVGALHWAFAMQAGGFDAADRWTWMGWSTMPALAAWAAAMLPWRIGIGVLLAVFLLHLALDHVLASRAALPPWYLRLRRLLTAGVALCLFAALAR